MEEWHRAKKKNRIGESVNRGKGETTKNSKQEEAQSEKLKAKGSS